MNTKLCRLGARILKSVMQLATTTICCWTTAASAQAAIYSYDSLNRLTNVNYGNGAIISYTYDAVGNRLTYSGVITNDVSDPTITITNPTSGPTFITTNATINLSGSGSDNTGISLISWENLGFAIGTASGTTSWSINDIGLQPGTNVIWLTAFDLAGNEGYAVLSVTYTPRVGPAIQTGFSGGGLSLSWPEALADGFVLQYADDLSPPILWSNVVATVTTNAGTLNVTLPTTNAQRYFRLKQ